MGAAASVVNEERSGGRSRQSIVPTSPTVEQAALGLAAVDDPGAAATASAGLERLAEMLKVLDNAEKSVQAWCADERESDGTDGPLVRIENGFSAVVERQIVQTRAHLQAKAWDWLDALTRRYLSQAAIDEMMADLATRTLPLLDGSYASIRRLTRSHFDFTKARRPPHRAVMCVLDVVEHATSLGLSTSSVAIRNRVGCDDGVETDDERWESIRKRVFAPIGEVEPRTPGIDLVERVLYLRVDNLPPRVSVALASLPPYYLGLDCVFAERSVEGGVWSVGAALWQWTVAVRNYEHERELFQAQKVALALAVKQRRAVKAAQQSAAGARASGANGAAADAADAGAGAP